MKFYDISTIEELLNKYKIGLERFNKEYILYILESENQIIISNFLLNLQESKVDNYDKLFLNIHYGKGKYLLKDPIVIKNVSKEELDIFKYLGIWYHIYAIAENNGLFFVCPPLSKNIKKGT